MADMVDGFARDFKPVDGGYIYYASPGSAGKFVTDEEYAALMRHWQRATGRRALWSAAAATLVVMGAVAVGGMHHVIGRKAAAWAMIGVPGLFFVWLFARSLWAGSAIRRVVAGQSDFAPRRPLSVVNREARAKMDWFSLLSGLLFAGVLAAQVLGMDHPGPGRMVWGATMAALFILYSIIAVQKLRDGKP